MVTLVAFFLTFQICVKSANVCMQMELPKDFRNADECQAAVDVVTLPALGTFFDEVDKYNKAHPDKQIVIKDVNDIEMHYLCQQRA